MKIVEVTGKTVKDAYQNALIQLNVTENKVTYEVIDEGSKGFLGIGKAILAKYIRKYEN